MKEITSFRGGYFFLSNFYPCVIEFDTKTYPTLEHAYQAAKTFDNSERLWIWSSRSPSVAKSRGRGVNIRADWNEIKLDIMLDLLRQKFSPYSVLGNKLLDTVDAELIEGNNWGDQFWGVCEGRGLNHLGRLLMQVREEIKAKEPGQAQ